MAVNTTNQPFTKVPGAGSGIEGGERAGVLSVPHGNGGGRSRSSGFCWLVPARLRGWLVGCLAVVVLAASVLVVPAGAAGVVAAEPEPAGASEAGEASGAGGAGVSGAVSGASAPLPVVSIVLADGNGLVAEGSPKPFTVSLSWPVDRPVTVRYSVSGTATAGVDYDVLSGSVLFGPMQTQATVWVSTTQDTLVEPAESVTLTLSLGPDYIVGAPGLASLTIVDDDAVPVTTTTAAPPPVTTPVVSVTRNVRSVTENTRGYFTVSLSSAPGRSITVRYAVSGTATSGIDYTALSGSVTFGAAQTSSTVWLRSADDSVDEPSESVTVTLSAGTGYTVSSTAAAATQWIDDNDDTAPVVSLGAGASTEGRSLVFTVRLSVASGWTLSVPYSVVTASTTASSSDYSLPAGPVVFAPGETYKTIGVPTVDDTIDEANESVTLQLDAGSNYSVSSTAGSASGWIWDNDPLPVASLGYTGNYYVWEGASKHLTVSLSEASGRPVTVSYGRVAAESTATAADYTLSPAGEVTFSPGETTKTITLAALSDGSNEPNETLTLGLLAGSTYTVSSTAGSVGLRFWSRDATPVVSISGGAAVTEGASAEFTVSLSAASGYELSVPFSVVTASTTAGSSDYSLPAGPLVFAPGETTKTISMAAYYDGVTESTEQVTVQLGSGDHYTVSSTAGSAVVMIHDNASSGPVASISGGLAVQEGSSVSLLVSLSVASGYPLSVLYSVVTGSTTAGVSDYSLPAGSLVFAPGETSKTIVMTVVDDSLDEPQEQVTVQLGTGLGYTVSSSAGSAVGQIIDNDDPPVAWILATSYAYEGFDATFTVGLSDASGYEVSVGYSVDTAFTTAQASDYSLPAGQLVFAPGETSKTLRMTTFYGAVDRVNETLPVRVRLDSGANYSVHDTLNWASIHIIDNPIPPVASISGDTVTEGDNLELTVSLSIPSKDPVEVPYSVVTGSATTAVSPGDYSLPVGPLVFARGETSKTIVMTTVDDSMDESDEQVTVQLGSGSGYTVSSTEGSAVAQITDND